MGAQYLLDTNVIIEFLGNALPSSGSDWLEEIIDQNIHYLSVITQIELLGFDGIPTEMQTLEEFVGLSKVVSLTEEIVEATIQLRKATKSNYLMLLLLLRQSCIT